MATPANRRDIISGGPSSVVETACPLDCPDACSLAVTVQKGRVVQIDGSHKNPVTDGRQYGAVRQDAVGHLSGLSGSGADRLVGDQPVGLGHSSGAVRA